MADINDQAQQWAQANPTHPMAQQVMAKAWASQNPSDPRSAQIMQKLQAQQTPAPDAADKAATASKPSAVSLNTPHFPASYTPGGTPAQASIDNPEATKALANVGTGLALGGIGGAITGGIEGVSGIAARAATNAGGAGLQKYFSNLMNGNNSSQGVTGNAILGGGLSALGDSIAAPFKAGADKLMQYSVGMRKNIPGVGTSLIDQGVMGTKNMMEDQVTTKLPEVEGKLQDLVKDLKGNIDAKDIGNAVSQKLKNFILPNGEIPANMQPAVDKVRATAENLSQLGKGQGLSPQDVLSLKRQGDWLGYTASGNPATSLEAELGQAQADSARGLLSKTTEGASADALKQEQALILAKKALQKPESIHQGVGSSLFFGRVPGAGILGSTGAHAADAAGNASSTMVSPQVLQSLFGGVNASQQ